ncbi:MAG: macro domain-containing protein [Caldisericota bacterium]|nr:macro domain-containing protein [Caldisericota bacterium]
MQILYEKEITGVKIQIACGDITEEEVDAIVNAANRYLSHGGGVAGAIVSRGGHVIQEESDSIIQKKGPLKVGEAVITSGGNLKAKYVIHTVGPVWGEGNEDDKLRNAILSVLTIATKYKLKSISILAVSCGIFGFPKKRGTQLICETIKQYLENNGTTLKEIHLIGIGEEVPELFKEAMADG